MELAIYEEVWSKCIKPKIDSMLSEDNDIFLNGGPIKEKIWQTYQKCRNSVHTYMYDPDGLIDRHKVAAVMMYSIIVNKPLGLKFLHVEQLAKGSSLLANETLGFYTALSIVRSFILSDAREVSNGKKIEIFINGFIFPVCRHEDYLSNVYKMLYYSNLNECYDIFALSHVLFLIEVYTESEMKNKLVDIVKAS